MSGEEPGGVGEEAVPKRGRTGPEGDLLDPSQVHRVRAVLSLGGVPHGDLPDGVQQVRLRLLERTAAGREAPRDLGAWAAVVASNLAADWHRARGRQDRLRTRLEALAPAGDGAEGGQEARLLSLAVAEGLDALPDGHRQVLILRFYADLSVPRIAEALDIPEGTVKSRLHKAARALRERLHVDEVV
ncbi:RNA polymerase sigma factor [Streptomyces cyaneofuscatus]|uniref:RNA polymerase sigma factor n=1 Tax=Streptomyces cyaneofuscatus TaxID=66883 RepID=UPI0036DA491F